MDLINIKYNRLFENPVYLEIIIAISGGYDYSTKIAWFLGKKQATVTEQLKLLEENKLIAPEKRGVSQSYSIRWRAIFDAFEEIVLEIIRKQQKYLGHSIIDLRKFNMDKVLPHELIEYFMRRYAIELTSIDSTPKPLSVLVPSIIIAMNNLTDAKMKKLAKRFGLDTALIRKLDNFMEFELSGLEWFVFNYHTDDEKK